MKTPEILKIHFVVQRDDMDYVNDVFLYLNTFVGSGRTTQRIPFNDNNPALRVTVDSSEAVQR